MYKISILKNGLRLVTAPIGGTKTATVLVLVGTGSKYETRETSGLSHFLEHMFFKGTKKRPTTLALSSDLDSIGVFNAFTSKEYTGFWVKGDSAKTGEALEILSDMLFNSKLEPKEIEREKGVINEEINMAEDDPMRDVDDLFETCLYGDTPAGRHVLGTKASVKGLGRQDILKYLKAQYSVDNTTICVAGNIKNEAALKKQASKYFSSQNFSKRGQGFREKEAVRDAQNKAQLLVKQKKSDQAHIALGVRTFPYARKEKAAIRLLSVILGGSMSARLFINLRERQGLAYYVRTMPDHYSDSGYLVTKAGVPVPKIDIAIKTILREYKKIKSTLVSADELRRAKGIIRSRLAIQIEASDEVAGWYAEQAVMHDTLNRTRAKAKALKLESPEEQLRKLMRVSSADIKRVAREIFVSKGLNLAVIGPFRDDKKLAKLLKI